MELLGTRQTIQRPSVTLLIFFLFYGHPRRPWVAALWPFRVLLEKLAFEARILDVLDPTCFIVAHRKRNGFKSRSP